MVTWHIGSKGCCLKAKDSNIKIKRRQTLEFLCKGPFKYYVSKEVVGGVIKWQFLLIYSTIYADVGGWVGLKKPKTC